LANTVGIPVAETFAGKGAVQQAAWWQLGGIGLEGTPATNTLASESDLVLTVGSRLTDFSTGSHSIFTNPDVRFASVNVNVHDADRLGAVGIIGDAKRALAALADASVDIHTSDEWRARTEELVDAWSIERCMALDPDQLFDKSAVPADSDVVTTTDAVLTQGQIIGVLQEHAQTGDVIIAAAGGPPGDLQKVWDATGGRTCHLEFGFSCMGYEIPAAIGVRLAEPDAGARITALLGDGTFLMAPTELVTAAQEALPITLVIPENHGYQVIHRLQMGRTGREFGNEFRYRTTGLQLTSPESVVAAEKVGRLDGDYLSVDLVQVAAGLGAHAVRALTASDLRDALDETRGHQGTVVIVVAAIPHADLPAAGVWWDVAPAEVSEIPTVPPLRADYEAGRQTQRWFG
ncbi:MAG TPA: thiamine pyrophosphate-dependent enzyme, partial [Kribbella sp.]